MNHCPFNFGFYLQDSNILVCHPRGELNSNLVSDIAVCKECSLVTGRADANRFHDLSDITAINLRFDDVRRICASESAMRGSAAPIKACYLVPNALLYGTIRMYQSMIEDCGVEVHVSYDIDDLAVILGVDPSVLATIPAA